MHLIYTPACKFAQNFDAVLIYDLFSIILFHIRWPCMHFIYTPACKLSQHFIEVLICDSFCFIFGDHACISSILQHVSLLKIFMHCDLFSILLLLFYPFVHILWPCMHLIYTPVCKLSQHFIEVLICDSFCFIFGDHACISSILQHVSLLKIFMHCDLFSIFLLLFYPFVHILWPCMHLIYTPVCKLSQHFIEVLICDSFCFIFGDHACISSILQPVSLLKILMHCWFMTCFPSCFPYNVTMHASHLYSSL